MEPSRGKWWNDVEGKWILTNLETEQVSFIDIPEDDEDILGDAKKDADESVNAAGKIGSKVVDTSLILHIMTH